MWRERPAGAKVSLNTSLEFSLCLCAIVFSGADGSSSGWAVQTITQGSSTPDVVLSKCLVLSSGLNTHHLLNPILSDNSSSIDPITPYYAKGNYVSYNGPGVSEVSHLIYPCPEAGLEGLGTHLTLDLAGAVKFGPNVEMIGSIKDAEEDPDFWQKHLIPSEDQLEKMGKAVQNYVRISSTDSFQS